MTNKIVYDIASSSDDPNIMNVSLSVKDSTGETSTLELEYTYDSNDYTTDIGLKQYLIYVQKGGSFDAEDNVNTVDSKSLPDEEEAIDQLNIDDSDVDYDQPGVYEITYSLTIMETTALPNASSWWSKGGDAWNAERWYEIVQIILTDIARRWRSIIMCTLVFAVAADMGHLTDSPSVIPQRGDLCLKDGKSVYDERSDR